MDKSPTIANGNAIPAISKQISPEEDRSLLGASSSSTNLSIAPMTTRLDHLSLPPRSNNATEVDAPLSHSKACTVDAQAHFDYTVPALRTNLNPNHRDDGSSLMASPIPTSRTQNLVKGAHFPILASTTAVEGYDSKTGLDAIGRKGSYASLQSNLSTDEPLTPGQFQERVEPHAIHIFSFYLLPLPC